MPLWWTGYHSRRCGIVSPMPFDHAGTQRARYLRRRADALVQLGGRCKCGSTTDLQFDHINPATKLHNLTTMFSKSSQTQIDEELAKCQLLCKECHEAKSRAEQMGRPAWNKGSRQDHGSYFGVYTLKCTCPDCATYLTDRKARRKVYRS